MDGRALLVLSGSPSVVQTPKSGLFVMAMLWVPACKLELVPGRWRSTHLLYLPTSFDEYLVIFGGIRVGDESGITGELSP